MKIVQCPKGGRVPEGYCQNSCLNFPHPGKEEDLNHDGQRGPIDQERDRLYD